MVGDFALGVSAVGGGCGGGELVEDEEGASELGGGEEGGEGEVVDEHLGIKPNHACTLTRLACYELMLSHDFCLIYVVTLSWQCFRLNSGFSLLPTLLQSSISS